MLQTRYPVSYTSVVNRGLAGHVESILEKIKEKRILDKDFLEPVNGLENVFRIIREVKDIPTFSHPIVSKEGEVFIDTRSFIQKSGNLKPSSDLVFLERRAALEADFVYNPGGYFQMKQLPIQIFSNWVSTNLASKLSLDIEYHAALKIMAAVYMHALLNQESTIKKDQIVNQLIRTIPQFTTIPSEIVIRHLEEVEESLVEFYLAITEGVTQNMLKNCLNLGLPDELQIDTPTIIETLGRTALITSNRSEITAIALESPSTFLALLIEVSIKGPNARTSLGQIVGYVERKHSGDWKRFTNFLTKRYTK